ncbi:hypothetical protein ACFL43_06050 [Thermodesulfobacteriota bacterium]
MSKRRSQTEHDRLVEYVAKLLIGRGYSDVRADIPGYEEPLRIKWQKKGEGFCPDVSGNKEGLRIFEVETGDSIDDEHTEAQWKLFASFAESNNAMFYVVFPKGCADKVKARLAQLSIKAVLMEV